MKTIFEKKTIYHLPKRTLLHKIFIVNTIVFMCSLFVNTMASNKLTMLLNTISLICWSFLWYKAAKAHKKTIVEYKEKVDQEKHDSDMKNAFNFGYYKNQ